MGIKAVEVPPIGRIIVKAVGNNPVVRDSISQTPQAVMLVHRACGLTTDQIRLKMGSLPSYATLNARDRAILADGVVDFPRNQYLSPRNIPEAVLQGEALGMFLLSDATREYLNSEKLEGRILFTQEEQAALDNALLKPFNIKTRNLNPLLAKLHVSTIEQLLMVGLATAVAKIDLTKEPVKAKYAGLSESKYVQNAVIKMEEEVARLSQEKVLNASPAGRRHQVEKPGYEVVLFPQKRDFFESAFNIILNGGYAVLITKWNKVYEKGKPAPAYKLVKDEFVGAAYSMDLLIKTLNDLQTDVGYKFLSDKLKRLVGGHFQIDETSWDVYVIATDEEVPVNAKRILTKLSKDHNLFAGNDEQSLNFKARFYELLSLLEEGLTLRDGELVPFNPTKPVNNKNEPGFRLIRIL